MRNSKRIWFDTEANGETTIGFPSVDARIAFRKQIEKYGWEILNEYKDSLQTNAPTDLIEMLVDTATR